MKIFEGLSKHQAVEINGRYVVQLEHNYSRRYYEVNGEKVNNSTQVVVDSLESIKRVTPSHPKLIHYTREDGSTVTTQEVIDFDKKWEHYEDEYDGMNFGDSVDIEIQYVKEKARFKNLMPVYEDTEVVVEDIEIDVVGSCEDTGSAFIETPFMYGQAKWRGHSVGVYKLRGSEVAMDQVRKIQEEHPKANWEIPSHSHLKYLQVMGKYVFSKETSPFIIREQSDYVYDSLDKAREGEEGIRKHITNVLKLHIKGHPASEVEIKDFVEHLETLRDSVACLDVKQKSLSMHRTLLTRISKLIDKYVEDN